MRILIAEDDTALAGFVRQGLQGEHYAVAESKNVRMVFEGSGDFFMTVEAGRRRLAGIVFRLLESVLSLAAVGSVVRTETTAASSSEISSGTLPERWIRVGWQGAAPRVEFSRPELGLLVAQAGWEHAGAQWERARTENRETVTDPAARGFDRQSGS